MAFDREDLDKAASRRAPEEITRLRMHQQAAVRMDLLTGDPSWDQYLSYLQSALDGAKKNRDGLMVRLASASLVNADQVALVRAAVLQLDRQIATLEWCMGMPSQIKKMGEVADDYLAKLEAHEQEAVAAE